MLEYFNNYWIIGISLLIFFFIIKKLINLNNTFDKKKFILQQKNKEKIKNKLKNFNMYECIPSVASYYLGIK